MDDRTISAEHAERLAQWCVFRAELLGQPTDLFNVAAALRQQATEIARLRAERDEARQCLAILQADFEDAVADQKDARSAR